MEWEDALEKLQLLLLLESKGSFLTESTEATPRLLKQLSVNEASSPIYANNFPLGRRKIESHQSVLYVHVHAIERSCFSYVHLYNTSGTVVCPSGTPLLYI